MTSISKRILSDIITCKIAPGAQLQEIATAKDYGVSRTKIRESFIELASQHFIRLVANKGAMVAPVDANAVFYVFEARIATERAAAALAAVRISNREATQFLNYVDEIDQAQNSADEDAFFAIDRQVHEAIALRSCNPFIIAQVSTYRDHTARCWHYYQDRGLVEKADYQGLANIIQSIVDRDSERASSAMQAHLLENLKCFQQMLSRQTEVLKWV